MPAEVAEDQVEDNVEVFDMPDEDFENMSWPPEEPAAEETPVIEVEEETPVVEKEEPPVEKEEEPVTEEEPETPATSDEPETEKEPEPEKEEDPANGGDTDKSVSSSDSAPAPINYEEEYQKIMAPFKANGQDMQAKSPEDAVRLMQMGANYHKKMAGLKPSLKTLKLLEKHELVDPDKLNYLIDLHNKNPEAITKLLQESQIDPLDLNLKEDINYTPTQRRVTDTELHLDTVLNELRDTPTYTRTLNVVSKEWDDASRDAIAATPQILGVINGHIADGTFDKVMGAVNYERTLGRLQGISDLEAYKRAGDTLAAAGQLPSHPVSEPKQEAVQAPVQTPAENPKEKERKLRKKAAGLTKSTPSRVQPAPDPLSMSDEEFLKFDWKPYEQG